MSPRYSQRVQQLPAYLFAELERKIQEKRDAGQDVISLGIGDPDVPTPESIVAELQRAAARPDTHRYPTNWGRPTLREAVAQFYGERFGVSLDPRQQVLPLMGAKEGVFHMCTVLLDVGDVALATDPGYPVYTSGPLLAGAEPYYLPLLPELGFKPDLGATPADVLARAKMLFINYPNNPTGAVVEDGDGFFERVVEFARANDVVVVHDNAYSEICFDGYRAPSFLETPGALDVGIELFSLSKAWNMTGWRAGAAVGNAEIVEMLWKLKTNVDSGMFEAVQMAAAKALTTEQDFPRDMSRLYQRRRDLVVDALRSIGLEPNAPRATIYVWVPVPEGYTSASFCELVLDQASVVVSPGASYGPNGEGYIRISLSTPDDRLREAIGRIASSLRVPA